jgi:hypothetical protein
MKGESKYIFLLCIVTSIVVTIACKKEKNNKWNRRITATVFLKDSIFHDWNEHKMAGLKIKLSRNTLYNADYLISDSTDQFGNVDFEIVPEEFSKDDILFLTYKGLIDGVQFEGLTTIKFSDPVNHGLYATITNDNKNKLVIKSFDSSGTNFIPSVNIYLFTSKLLADSFAIDHVYANSIGNKQGESEFRDIQPGKYYLSARVKIGNDTINRISKTLIVPENTILFMDSVILK